MCYIASPEISTLRKCLKHKSNSSFFSCDSLLSDASMPETEYTDWAAGQETHSRHDRRNPQPRHRFPSPSQFCDNLFSQSPYGGNSTVAMQPPSQPPSYTMRAAPPQPGDHAMPFTCSECGRGYMTQSGLNLHLPTHQGKNFSCVICDAKFSYKGNIKSHMKARHNSAQCPTCLNVFKLGVEYNQHVLHCK